MEALRYNDEQIARVVRNHFVTFGAFIERVREEAPDEKFVVHVDRLLMTIFINKVDGKYLSLTQACRMIPAEHADTCRKYVDEASRLGFFKVVDDPNDKRKKRVIPTAEFIDYVRYEAQSALEKALAIAEMASPGIQQSS